jgi:hypothetical protein
LGLSNLQIAATNTVAMDSMAAVVHDSLKIDNSKISVRSFSNLKEKYVGDEFIYEQKKVSTGWWSRFKQWLNDTFQDLFNLKNQGQAAKATDLAIKIGGVILFLLVAYFIFKAIINKEGTWIFGKSSDKSIIPVSAVEKNIQTTDFYLLIQDAESNNNYRLAIRYYYLLVLKGLSKAEIIRYDVEKTNSDYSNEISEKLTKEQFSYTVYLYNYIWYGEFDVNHIQFNKAKHAFIQFLNTLESE